MTLPIRALLSTFGFWIVLVQAVPAISAPVELKDVLTVTFADGTSTTELTSAIGLGGPDNNSETAAIDTNIDTPNGFSTLIAELLEKAGGPVSDRVSIFNNNGKLRVYLDSSDGLGPKTVPEALVESGNADNVSEKFYTFIGNQLTALPNGITKVEVTSDIDVPEPSAFLVLATGLVMLIGIGCRRRQTSRSAA